MCASVIINGFLGFGMVIAVLFCLSNVDDAINTPTHFPVVEIFTQATRSPSGGTAMVRNRKPTDCSWVFNSQLLVSEETEFVDSGV